MHAFEMVIGRGGIKKTFVVHVGEDGVVNSHWMYETRLIGDC
jgi:hypothetical protein